MLVEEERNDLKGRTRDFSLRIIKLYTALPKSAEAQVLGENANKPPTGSNF